MAKKTPVQMLKAKMEGRLKAEIRLKHTEDYMDDVNEIVDGDFSQAFDEAIARGETPSLEPINIDELRAKFKKRLAPAKKALKQ